MNEMPQEEQKRQKLHSLQQNFSKDANTIEFVYTCLGDESWRVRKDAVTLCEHNPIPEIITILIQGLASEDNAGLRNASQETLTRIGVPAVPQLIVFFDSADNDVRKFILDILGDIGDSSYCSFLIKALRDPDENVAIAACENIGKIRCQVAISPLLEMLNADKQWLSFVIIASLAQIGAPFNAEPFIPLWDIAPLRKPIIDLLPLIGDPHDIEFLKKAFRDPSAYLHENAAKNLYKIFERSPERFPQLKTALRKDITFSPNLKNLLNGRSENEKTFALLAYITESEDFFDLVMETGGDEGQEFFGSLIQYAPFGNAPMIIDRIDKYRERKQAYLVYLCGVFSLKTSIDKIIPLAGTSYGHTRQTLSFALGKIGGEKALPPLYKLLFDDYPDVREQAVIALAGLLTGDKFPDDLARKVIAENRPEKMFTLLQLMDKLGHFKNEYIYQALKSPSSLVRSAAIDIIGRNHLVAFLNDVMFFMTDEDEEVQMKAIETIGAIGSSDNAVFLLNFLNSDNFPLRKAAIFCIRKLAPQLLILNQEKLFKDTSPLFFLALLELFSGGVSFDPKLVISVAMEIDDIDVYMELIKALKHAGLKGPLKELQVRLTDKKGGDYIPSHIFDTSEAS